MGRMVLPLPIAVGRNVVDVRGIFGVASPRVPNIVEVVRPQLVTSQAPAGTKTLVCHMHGTDADVVDGTDVPTEMVQARAATLRQSDQVMIATVNTVHESDAVAGSVRKAQAEHARIEQYARRYVGREDQDVGQAARVDPWRKIAGKRSLSAGRRRDHFEGRLRIRRRFLRNTQFDQQPIGGVKQKAVRFQTGRRIEQRDRKLLQPSFEAREVILEDAETEMG